MKHPFEALKPEYSQLLSVMAVRPEKRELVDKAAVRIIGFRQRFEQVTAADGVPVIFQGPSFYREADLDFAKNPAQGWPLTSISRIIPHNGPFRTWFDAAVAAYRENGLDRVGVGNWTWELICFYAEMFNGFGYRDFHRMHSPYLWGGTNIQTVGKYTADDEFDAAHMDEQLGVIPIAKRIAEIAPDLALPFVIAPPIHSGIAAPDTGVDTKWVQHQMNLLGWQPPLAEDGSYGGKTLVAVQHFQKSWGLKVDFAGPETIGALKAAAAAIEAEAKKA